ncbi:DUF47 domain-containing protein [Plantibacter sp. YIM 135347]|jgi:hypothetical protein|uniref:DUF47 domain-containing protein n=1 Tax=Plantibacter sp. YIM 135347 TaxID=3423919 RepID=UPI003D3371BB
MSRLSDRLRHRKRRTIPELLLRQIDHTIAGVALARQVCAGPGDALEAGPDLASAPVSGTPPVSETGRSEMAEIEHRGDSARARLIDHMSSSLTTPLDREDIFRASRSIDDVLDNVRDFIRELDLWQVRIPAGGADALEAIADALVHLQDGVRSIRLPASQGHLLAARKAAKGVRSHYQHGLAEIFDGELTMDTLKRREALRRLDVVSLRLVEAADALLDGQIKRTM